MKIIELILEDFYNCSRLPIKALDLNLKDIYSKGYDSKFENLFKEFNILSDLKNIDPNLSKLTLSYTNNTNFLVTPISKYNNSKGFYILGPYNADDRYAVNYLLSLLNTIHEDKFSGGRTQLNFSPCVKKAVKYCLEYYDSYISIDTICEHLNINKSYFCKKFKQETGYTFCNFLSTLRVEKSKILLKNLDMSLLDIAISVGFNSQNYYTVVFKKISGFTPLEYRHRIC